MKVYRAMEERGLVLSFHSGPNWARADLQEPATASSRCMRSASRWYNILHCTNWVINGMGERFPKLPVVWIESGLAWVPFLMQRLDHEYMLRPSEAPLLKKKPSDYMRDMYYSSQPMEIQDMEALECTFRMINAETQLLYSSDYPHWDFDLPLDDLRTCRSCRRRPSTTSSAAPRRACSSCRRATRSRRRTCRSSATSSRPKQITRRQTRRTASRETGGRFQFGGGCAITSSPHAEERPTSASTRVFDALWDASRSMATHLGRPSFETAP